MADYGILFLSKMFMYREGDDGYITPVRNAPGSLTFGIDQMKDYTTVTEYLELYDGLSEMEGTGYDTTLFMQAVLMMMCTVGRLIDGTAEDMLNMQCYDNFVADIYLTEPEGLYAMIDLFTWKGIGIAYLIMTVNSALATIGASMLSYSMIYLFYLINIKKLTYGTIELVIPIYDDFFADEAISFDL